MPGLRLSRRRKSAAAVCVRTDILRSIHCADDLSAPCQAFRIVSRVVVAPGQPLYHALQPWSAIQGFASSLASLDPQNRLDLPLLPHASSTTSPSRQAIQRYLRLLVITLSAPPPALEGSPVLTSAREKLESFLLGSSSSQKISGRDLAEWVRRGEEEEDKEDKRHVKWVEMGRRVKKLRTTWVNYRKALIEGGELGDAFPFLLCRGRLLTAFLRR